MIRDDSLCPSQRACPDLAALAGCGENAPQILAPRPYFEAHDAPAAGKDPFGPRQAYTELDGSTQGAGVPRQVAKRQPKREVQQSNMQREQEEDDSLIFDEDPFLEVEGCGSWLVIREDNAFRKIWNGVLCLLLLYTATVFPYQLSFLDFRIPDGCCMSDGWELFNTLVDILFWFDFFINFFLTYEDSRGNEVVSLPTVVCNYLRGSCMLNLVACLPEGAAIYVVRIFVETDNPGLSKLTRVSRIQRLSRITRMARFVKIINSYEAIRESPLWIMLQQQRGVRVVNFVFGLLWVVHLIACGWYLCAALHPNAETITWVARREIEPGGFMLVDAGPFTQWLNSMYFVLTVFSTVGFGDMSAWTFGEISYCCFTMVVGAIVHSIIMSEVIGAIRTVDDAALRRTEHKKLVSAFAYNADLQSETVRQLEEWIDLPLKGKNGKRVLKRYDRDSMRRLLTSGGIPRSILGRLPVELYGGKLMKNKFVTFCTKYSAGMQMPPRFPLLIAVSAARHTYLKGEVVYQVHDHPFSMFLVLDGVFAAVGKPNEDGGSEAVVVLSGAAERGAEENVRSPSRISRTQSGFARGRTGSTCSSAEESPNLQEASPYQLYCAGSYFGELEIIFPSLVASGHTRACTVRCESRMAQVLVLSRENLTMLVQEFPQYHVPWRIAATHRERSRQQLLRGLTRPMPYRQLAAQTIQRAWRATKAEECPKRASSKRISLLPSMMNGISEAAEDAAATRQLELDRKRRGLVKEDVLEAYERLAAKVEKLSDNVHCEMVSIWAALKSVMPENDEDTQESDSEPRSSAA
eukprot:TRINITY_DN25822_c0_g1_i1.p1 TRINITY_DN25822_c0_g1~~TRINITY_DN25822_c0_g1_i1.p1  ORF type:complete len:805 (+),score=93.42 TRINITY_DN25822_c0_g1_i1:77-2491(+)